MPIRIHQTKLASTRRADKGRASKASRQERVQTTQALVNVDKLDAGSRCNLSNTGQTMKVLQARGSGCEEPDEAARSTVFLAGLDTLCVTLRL